MGIWMRVGKDGQDFYFNADDDPDDDDSDDDDI